MDRKLTLNMESLTVTSFETHNHASAAPVAAAATLATTLECCGSGCNTRLTCSSALC